LEETNGKTMVSFQMDTDLVAEIDTIAKEKRKYRSDILRDAVTDYLKHNNRMPIIPETPIAPTTKS
jgi:metal-responsive CopG/Arc/MetJ family transcriptional regulator